MTLDRFLIQGEPTWTELQSLVDQAGSRPKRLGSDRFLRLGTLYRSAAADLSQARLNYPGDPVVTRLETLVMKARGLVYAKRRGKLTIREFYAKRYWELIVERRGLLLLAFGALFVPALIGFLNPETFRTLVPTEALVWTEARPEGTDLGLSQAALTEFSVFVLVNNIQVTILAFATGILFGVVTFTLIAYNGLILGAFSALVIEAGNAALLTEIIVAHGVLELSCIVVGAAAGFRLASAVVNPGLRPRRVALTEEAGQAALLAIGTAPFLVLAGFVEGFVSRTGNTAGISTVIGFTIGGGFWLLAAVLGTRQNRTRALASRYADTQAALR